MNHILQTNAPYPTATEGLPTEWIKRVKTETDGGACQDANHEESEVWNGGEFVKGFPARSTVKLPEII